jgi:hypothetical protein
MNNPVEHLFRVTDSQGNTHGVAFFVTPRVALTCQHVVEGCGVKSGGNVGLIREGDEQHKSYQALVERTSEIEDVAVLILHKIPSHFGPFVLGPSENAIGSEFYSFGYPNNSEAGVAGYGK